MHNYTQQVAPWKKTPFIRILLPFTAGIVMEWYLQFPLLVIVVTGMGFIAVYLLFHLLPIAMRFRLQSLQGVVIYLLVICFGLLVTWQHDTRNSKSWYGHYYRPGDLVLVKIDEPLVAKNKSYKAIAQVKAVVHDNRLVPCKGKLVIYFSRDTTAAAPVNNRIHYGDLLLFSKGLQPIRNSGNPGAFNYERYAAFQHLFHTAFLKEKDWQKLPSTEVNRLRQFIFSARDLILSALRKNMVNGRDELGIAQALLIGYTNDLDRDLVQAYSNTGVVHIIAISGMHLALIYLLLVAVFARIPGLKQSQLLQLVLVLSCLWLFSLLTGASASVLRAAVMFSFIAVGRNIKRTASIYNSLAASAFVLVWYNPYFLWDVGFQLSYLAVVSIIVFQKPVLHCLPIKNKWLQKIWELAAVSLAAQILTFPACIYYFHQFPNLFLITNIIAVPLSSLILYAEIGLVAIAWLPVAAPFTGRLVGWLVWVMNQVILAVDKVPWAVWKDIPATVLSTWLLYVALMSLCAWLIHKRGWMLSSALVFTLVFTCMMSYLGVQVQQQKKVVVYNISQHRAIDFIKGDHCVFAGDSSLRQDAALQQYNLAPTRTALQVSVSGPSSNFLFQRGPFYQFGNKKIFLIDETLSWLPADKKMEVDLVVISKNPKLQIAQLAAVINCSQIVFDASNSLWKIDKWQRECEELHLRSYSVPAQGAFVMDIMD